MSETLSADSATGPGSIAARTPICVDLDGTLVRTDTLVENVLGFGPSWRLLHAVLLLLVKGRAAFKAFVAREVALNPGSLPYNENLLRWLRAKRMSGHPLILTTAADLGVARAVADHLGLFDDVIASDGVRNNKGAAKAEALVQRYGRGGFVYVGDHRSDLHIWRVAGGGVTVNAAARVRAAARRHVDIHEEIDARVLPVRAAIGAMRPHQWVKNLLVFVPIFTAHVVGEPSAWLAGIAMFAAFCATASGIYLVNDLFDLAADRAHPRKRNRPLASGALPLPLGFAMAPVLLALGVGLAATIHTAWVIALYAVMSVGYSLKLKEMPLVDVFMLAALYTIRIFGGSEAIGHALSLWLLAFSSFTFLSLALVKRVEELTEIARTEGKRANRRGYDAVDAVILQQFGCCSAFASCIVLALFVQNEVTAGRYASPELLWGIVPLMLFWQARLWLSTARGYMHDDPIIYAARDWVSWVVAAFTLAILMLASSGFAPGA